MQDPSLIAQQLRNFDARLVTVPKRIRAPKHSAEWCLPAANGKGWVHVPLRHDIAENTCHTIFANYNPLIRFRLESVRTREDLAAIGVDRLLSHREPLSEARAWRPFRLTLMRALPGTYTGEDSDFPTEIGIITSEDAPRLNAADDAALTVIWTKLRRAIEEQERGIPSPIAGAAQSGGARRG